MSPLAALAAALALMITPGPTNALLAAAGAERGLRGVLRLIPVVLVGYLLTVVPLTLGGAALLARAPQLRIGLTLVAAAWVAWLAVALWRVPSEGRAGAAVTARRILVTTLLNPKALVFGLVILPAATWARALGNLAIFAALVLVVSAFWAGLGSALRRGRTDRAPGLPTSWRRGTSLLLGGLAVWLAARVAGLA